MSSKVGNNFTKEKEESSENIIIICFIFQKLYELNTANYLHNTRYLKTNPKFKEVYL